ncbi:magnesium transporter [Candidatus Paracaedibacter symbiosus]|uniref:magnesium transporter n=1 Tax=Candidatus Paracaedibacter symbiosus TaxID=244582 RepID=UPI0005099A18|nr:magnesium transporter [Candidatus Paracaedibacter symbiosus]
MKHDSESVTSPNYNYSVSSEHIKLVRGALQAGDEKFVQELISGLHAADVADIIEQLSHSQRVQFVGVLRPHFDPEILMKLDEYIREEIVHLLSSKEIASVITQLQSDEAVTLYDELDSDIQQRVLADISELDRKSIEFYLDYEEESAGRLMQREMVAVASHLTLGQIIDSFEGGEDLAEGLSQVIVVNEKNQPIGSLSLSRLLQLSRRKIIADVMDRDIKIIPVTMKQEEVAFYFRQYTLTSVPVVEAEGNLVGIITATQIIDVIQDEAEKDLMQLGRVSEPTFSKPIVELSLNRLRWLIVTFINTLLASTVISHFETEIQKIVALAVLMPIVASMGGNSGMQVVTVTVRALAQRDLRKGQVFSTLLKEMGISLLNSFILAGVLSFITTCWYHDMTLGLILGGALMFNMLWSGLAGTLFPVILDRLGFDPAIGSGPLLTTTTDVLGFSVFLGLATIFLF